MLLTAISLALIGVFPEDVRPHHLLASVAFFTFSLLSFLILGPLWLRKPSRPSKALGTFMIASAVIGAAFWALWGPLGIGPGVAIPETVSAALVSVCTMAVGAQMALGKL